MAKCSLLEQYNRGSKYKVLLPAVEVEVCAKFMTMETIQTKSVEKLRSTPGVVPGAAPAMARAGVGGYEYRRLQMTHPYYTPMLRLKSLFMC